MYIQDVLCFRWKIATVSSEVQFQRVKKVSNAAIIYGFYPVIIFYGTNIKFVYTGS